MVGVKPSIRFSKVPNESFGSKVSAMNLAVSLKVINMEYGLLTPLTLYPMLMSLQIGPSPMLLSSVITDPSRMILTVFAW